MDVDVGLVTHFIKLCTVEATEYIDGRGTINTTYFEKDKFARLVWEAGYAQGHSVGWVEALEKTLG